MLAPPGEVVSGLIPAIRLWHCTNPGNVVHDVTSPEESKKFVCVQYKRPTALGKCVKQKFPKNIWWRHLLPMPHTVQKLSLCNQECWNSKGLVPKVPKYGYKIYLDIKITSKGYPLHYYTLHGQSQLWGALLAERSIILSFRVIIQHVSSTRWGGERFDTSN